MPRTIHERADTLPALGELFREHGYEGTSLALISAKTGLGKGSLYHFFPGGKEEMAAAVLAHIDEWFERQVFKPLREGEDARAAIHAMFRTVDEYFRSGRRVCLVGAFALGGVRGRYAERINQYFSVWIEELASALRRAGTPRGRARASAEDAIAMIQGALVAARALDDAALFRRALKRAEARLTAQA
ncbi:MAG TPA: TetR/AcrR family transcriptional regulator [Dokdonella sp.]